MFPLNGLRWEFGTNELIFTIVTVILFVGLAISASKENRG